MPTLKQINCSIELGNDTALKEYGIKYDDGVVETYIAVPNTKQPFQIHVQSTGYIAPGLAVFVFMDGIYQANRNKLDLKLHSRNGQRQDCEIDFLIRQKEEKDASGLFVGREWTFAHLATCE